MWAHVNRSRVLRGGVLALVCVGSSACTPSIATKEDVQRLSSSVNDMRALNATQTTQLATLESQLRQLVGRIEELEHSQNTQLSADLSNLKSDLSNLKRRVPPPPIVPAAALDEDESSVSMWAPEVASPLGEGLGMLRTGSYTGALQKFREAYEIGRGSEVTALTQFWSGVAYDGLGNNKEALAAYHDMATRYPKHARVPLALLRQGSVLVRLGDPKTAGLIFKKLIAQYPKSAEAERAKERLKDVA